MGQSVKFAARSAVNLVDMDRRKNFKEKQFHLEIILVCPRLCLQLPLDCLPPNLVYVLSQFFNPTSAEHFLYSTTSSGNCLIHSAKREFVLNTYPTSVVIFFGKTNFGSGPNIHEEVHKRTKVLT
jgi:hypothetical protein